MPNIFQKLDATAVAMKSLVCVGLDPDPAQMPVTDVFSFNREIIDATKHAACAYKPQIAFYEALGIRGLEALKKTTEHIRSVAPDAVIIGDCKRGDIGSTATAYARAMFEFWGFDIVTVFNYMGFDAVEPFLKYPERGVYVVCRSSNPGAKDIQDIESSGRKVFQHVADAAVKLDPARVGLVVGATYPGEMQVLRSAYRDTPFLIPGVGAQGGDAAAAARAGADMRGRGFVINSSRGIIYASKDRYRFADAARAACEKLRDEINLSLAQVNAR